MEPRGDAGIGERSQIQMQLHSLACCSLLAVWPDSKKAIDRYRSAAQELRTPALRYDETVSDG